MADNPELDLIIKRREVGRGGGVGILYHKDKVSLKKVHLPTDTGLEILTCHGSTKHSQLLIISLYYPPGSRQEDAYNEALSNHIQFAFTKMENPLVILGGDFNHLNLSALMDEFPGFQPLNHLPTRENSILDQILTNKPSQVIDVTLHPPLDDDEGGNPSDHKIVGVRVREGNKNGPLEEINKKWKTVEARAMDRWRVQAFKQDLKRQDWTVVVRERDVNKKVELFTERINCLVEQHFPLKLFKKRNDDKPWMTLKIKRLINRRRRLFKRRGKCGEWRRLKRLTDEEVRLRKKTFWESQTSKILNARPDQWWKAIRCLLSDEEKPTWDPTNLMPGESTENIANWLSKFFSDITADFTPLPDYIPPSGHRPPFLLTEDEVLLRLKKQKVTKSLVPGDIPGKVYKSSLKFLLRPLTSIYNAILLWGIWPEAWKRETGIVIPKVDSPTSPNQTRLIRLTPSFAKVGEGILLEPLLKAIMPKMDLSQFGGLPGVGTTEALISLSHQVAEAIDDGKDGVLLSTFDYSKAFDRAAHQLILSELQFLECPEWIVNIVQSYLTGRKLTVRVGDTTSEERTLKGGSSQGARLGVILFIIACNRITKNFPQRVKSFRYVDDVLNAEKVKLEDEIICTNSQIAFENLIATAQETKMLINPEKTKIMVVHRSSREIKAKLNVPDTDDEIESGGPLRLLGYMAGTNMTDPEVHVQEVEKKVRKRLWMITRLKRGGVEEARLVQIYMAMVRSVIEYVSPVYHSWLRAGQAERLERLQRRALKMIFGFGTSYRRCLEKAKIDRLDIRRDQALIKYAKKMSSDPRFECLFPRINRPAEVPITRRSGLYDDHIKWSSQGLKRSPVILMRKILNDQCVPGRIPGIRYAT